MTAPHALYANVVVLDAETHAQWSAIPLEGRYPHAVGLMAVPINLDEFAAACRHYPIVFAPEQRQAIAVLGMRQGENRFVASDGTWRADTYVPAYVRRYPFIFVETAKPGQLLLGIDDTPATIERSGRLPLFDGTAASRTSHAAMKLCAAFHEAAQTTARFIDKLVENGLLVPREVQIDRGGEARHSVGGFQLVDEARLNAVDDATFREWRRLGWAHCIYTHLVSFASWGNLLQSVAPEPQSERDIAHKQAVHGADSALLVSTK